MDKFEEIEILRTGFMNTTQFFLTGEEKHNIVFLRIDMNLQTYEDYHFLLLIKAVHNLGHKVYVITNNSNPRVNNILPKSVTIYKVGSFIPLKMFSRFGSSMRVFRTFYAGLWILCHKYTLKPSLIITHTVNSIIPVLKILGSFPIVQVYNFSERQVVDRIFMKYEPIKSRYLNLCVDCCNEIIVPNKISKYIFNDCFKGIEQKLTVIYPCVETTLFSQCPIKKLSEFTQIPEDSYIFVQFEAQRYESNFELTVFAFMDLLRKVRNYSLLYNNLYLVIVGRYEDAEMFQNYLNRANYILENNDLGRYCIVFLKHSQAPYRKTLLSKCIAVIHPTLYDVNPRPILEAGLMKKPVITTRSGISKELIINEQNGFFAKHTPADYSKYMYSLLFHDDIHTECSNKSFIRFKKYCGLTRLESEMQKIINRNATKQRLYSIFQIPPSLK